MALKDTTSYQSKVGRLQDADRFYGKDGGVFQMEDGFAFYAEDGSGNQKTINPAANYTRQIIGQGAGSTLLSVVNYVSGVGMVVFSMTSTMVVGAFALVSGVQAGEEVLLKINRGSTLSGEVTVTFSGCSFVGLYGSTLNSITMHNSEGSAAWLKLKSFADDEWTVVDFYNNVLCEE